MDNQQNERAARIVGQSPSRRLFSPNHMINILLGFGMASAIGLSVKYTSTGSPGVAGLLFIGAIPAVFLLEYVIKRLFKPDFELQLRWGIVGMVVATLTVMPLVITPRCGWNNDQCKPHSNLHHHVRR